ncbi:MAG: hypothetical protein NC299_13610 [Lachnospiraceae bacterium]|nr:hypothetical protein [Ruminococcus sp.]MCM1276372.1 hypothetical protein [Lachnospiraceae bacterium]
MKKTFIALAALAAVLSLGGCASNAPRSLAGSYVYEKGGFAGGDFGITLFDDGTFSYYEGYFSSYVGYGNWSVENGELVLAESEDMGCRPFVHRFKVDGDDLVYQAEGSDDFIYVNVEDGDRFLSDNE